MKEKIFGDNSPILNFFRRVGDIMILNFLFIITCIPVITIGASLTSLYYVSINALGRDDGYIFKMYVRSFKQNFKQATKCWIGYFFLLTILVLNIVFSLRLYNTTDNMAYKISLIVGVVLLINVVLVFSYTWPLIAKFENTVLGTLKNAALMVVTHIPETIGLCLIPIMFFYLSYAVLVIRPFSILFGFGIIGYMQALVLRHVLKPYLENEEPYLEDEELYPEKAENDEESI